LKLKYKDKISSEIEQKERNIDGDENALSNQKNKFIFFKNSLSEKTCKGLQKRGFNQN